MNNQINILVKELIDKLREVDEVSKIIVLIATEEELLEQGFGCLACCVQLAEQFAETHCNEIHEVDIDKKEIRH